MNEEKESDIFRELIKQVHGKSEITFIPLQISLFMTFFPKDALNFDNKDGGWRQRVTGLRRVINNNYNYYQLTEFLWKWYL